MQTAAKGRQKVKDALPPFNRKKASKNTIGCSKGMNRCRLIIGNLNFFAVQRSGCDSSRLHRGGKYRRERDAFPSAPVCHWKSLAQSKHLKNVSEGENDASARKLLQYATASARCVPINTRRDWRRKFMWAVRVGVHFCVRDPDPYAVHHFFQKQMIGGT